MFGSAIVTSSLATTINPPPKAKANSCLVLLDDTTDLRKVLLRENEADVSLDVWEEALEARVPVEVSADGLPYGGVLAHHDHALATQGDPYLLHLLRAHIVGIDNEHARVLVK